MKRTIYRKSTQSNIKLKLRIIGVALSFVGIVIVFYIFTPLLAYQLIYAPIFAAQKIVAPIPPNILVSAATSLPTNVNTVINNVDFTNAENWFPKYKQTKKDKSLGKADYYTLTIPKINIKSALVSAIDNDLSLHLVNFGGTAVPPNNGTAVVFGHSTLQWLYDPKNYKTILANAIKLSVGDAMTVSVNNVQYTYKIYSITVVDPDDISVFDQRTDTSYLTLVTCTPPGTVLYRLVIRSRLEKI